MDNKVKILVFSSLLSFLALGVIVGSFFIQNVATKSLTIKIGIFLLLIQQIFNFIMIKENRKITIAILTFVLVIFIYFLIAK